MLSWRIHKWRASKKPRIYDRKMHSPNAQEDQSTNFGKKRCDVEMASNMFKLKSASLQMHQIVLFFLKIHKVLNFRTSIILNI